MAWAVSMNGYWPWGRRSEHFHYLNESRLFTSNVSIWNLIMGFLVAISSAISLHMLINISSIFLNVTKSYLTCIYWKHSINIHSNLHRQTLSKFCVSFRCLLAAKGDIWAWALHSWLFIIYGSTTSLKFVFAHPAGAIEYNEYNECPVYDIKQFDVEVQVLLELWAIRSTPSLPLL